MMRKNMIKKLLVSVPVLSVALVSLASCGGNAAPTTTGSVDPTVVIPENAVFVSSDGKAKKDGADGSIDKPYDFETATFEAKPGDTLYLKGGSYKYKYRLGLSKSGEAGKYITVMPQTSSDRVIFDFSEMLFDGSNRGIQIYGNYWHFYNVEITGAGDNGMYIAGNHNIIEQCQFYNNRDTGLQIGRGYSEYTTLDTWPSYNIIKNCTSFANYDPDTLGENADGFAAKLTIGHGNVFDGCIAFRNSDDGWDMFAKVDSGNIGAVYLYNCVSFENGFLPYQIDKILDDGSTIKSYDTPNGDGIGFKLGGSTMEGDVFIDNCLAFNNKLHGFGDNSNPGVISIKNSTAFNNCVGVTDDGSISPVRGFGMTDAKSNNIDLARSTASYNNYYGVLSYVNNQKNFSPVGESSYNVDSYRGSVGYSIFNPSYDKGEQYITFTGYEDGSSFATETVDTAYEYGTAYTGLSDASFADLTPFNMKCDQFTKLDDMCRIHKELRNADGSVNMGDKIKVVDQNLLTYANGKPIGASLSKTSYADYPHSDVLTFNNAAAAGFEADKVDVLSAYSAIQPLTSLNATFQDFEIPKLISGCDINWTSSNTNVIVIDSDETSSVSTAVYSRAKVIVPEESTKVTVTATVSKGKYLVAKTFEINVVGRNQKLGALASTGPKSIKIDKYGIFNAPRVYALDSSSTYGTDLPLSEYTLETTYKYASNGASSYYPVDGVYTSIPGVYEVTSVATATYDSKVTSTFVYKVYVVDKDCAIDFNGDPVVGLTRDGIKLEGDLTNVEGSVAAIVSKTAKTDLTLADFIGEDGADKEGVQYVKINIDYVSAEFMADNLEATEGDVQYYVYYVVLNANKTNVNEIKSITVKKESIDDVNDFYRLARGITSSDATTIYTLTKDLDYADYYWYVTNKTESTAFKGLLNGNGHTVSNISITAENAAKYAELSQEISADKTALGVVLKSDIANSEPTAAAETTSNNEKYFNVFYKLQNATLMNINFNNILINNSGAKILGVVGDMQGGYIHKVKLTNIGMIGKESCGAMVGQITGGVNHISQVSLVNPIPDAAITDHSETVANDYIPEVYKISTTNKYAGGIVGNVQMNSDQSLAETYIDNCYVKANIGASVDAQGNVGGIVGRVKNDSVKYKTEISYCYYVGTVIGKGQYLGGMIGDLDNGSGATKLVNNLADARFVWNSIVLDWKQAVLTAREQQYAHKNSNPLIGRATLSELGSYTCINNIGSWKEYYETNGMISSSMAFDFSGEEDDGSVYLYEYTDFVWKTRLAFDMDIWGIDPTTHQAYLK